jgi:hypothetical protein
VLPAALYQKLTHHDVVVWISIGQWHGALAAGNSLGAASNKHQLPKALFGSVLVCWVNHAAANCTLQLEDSLFLWLLLMLG